MFLKLSIWWEPTMLCCCLAVVLFIAICLEENPIISMTSSGRIALGKPCSLFHTSSFAFSQYHSDFSKAFCYDALPTCQSVVA
jgi:hypothetical protein